MKKEYYKIFVLLYLLLSTICNKNIFAQTVAKIENTNLEMNSGRLIVSYDLINTRPNERFNVWIEIRKSSGQEIKARNISGHVGKNIVGGKGLNVVWNFGSEGLDIEDEINVQVMAELVTVNNLKVERILLKSVAFPGWGLYDMDKISPYLLLGVAGYGSLATALIYNGKSNTTYDNYLKSDGNERETLFDDYTKQVNMTNVMGITTAAIWILDIGWSAIKYVSKTSNLDAGLNPKIHIGYDYDPYGQVPLLSLKYNF